MPSARRICGSSSTTSTRLIDARFGRLIDHRESAARRVLDGDLAAHRLDESPRDRQARARRPLPFELIAEPLERLEDVRSRWSGGMPGPRSTTRRSTRSRDRAGLDAHRACPAATTRSRCRRGWRSRARAARRRRAPAAASRRTSTSTCAARSPSPRSRPARPPRGRRRASRAAARRSAAGSCRAGCPTSVLSRSVSSSIVSSSSRVASGRPVDVALEQARHRRLDRRQRRAQIVRHRGEQRGAQLVGLGEPRRDGGFGAQLPLLERRAPAGR